MFFSTPTYTKIHRTILLGARSNAAFKSTNTARKEFAELVCAFVMSAMMKLHAVSIQPSLSNVSCYFGIAFLLSKESGQFLDR